MRWRPQPQCARPGKIGTFALPELVEDLAAAGLLVPAAVDPEPGYGDYAPGQLREAHAIRSFTPRCSSLWGPTTRTTLSSRTGLVVNDAAVTDQHAAPPRLAVERRAARRSRQRQLP